MRLEYSSTADARPSVWRLIAGLLCAFFLLLWGVALLAGGLRLCVMALSSYSDVGHGWGIIAAGIVLAVLGGVYVGSGVVQVIGSFAAMWHPQRRFWWDRWFITISGTQHQRRR